jgi:hypothetical protein
MQFGHRALANAATNRNRPSPYTKQSGASCGLLAPGCRYGVAGRGCPVRMTLDFRAPSASFTSVLIKEYGAKRDLTPRRPTETRHSPNIVVRRVYRNLICGCRLTIREDMSALFSTPQSDASQRRQCPSDRGPHALFVPLDSPCVALINATGTRRVVAPHNLEAEQACWAASLVNNVTRTTRARASW